MAKHRQPKGRLRDKDIATAGLERRTGRIRPPLVVAGNHDPGAAVLKHDLGAAEHVTGRHQPHRHPTRRDRFAVAERLQRAAGRLAVALLHDRDRAGSGEHPVVAGPRMITMPMGDHRARHRAQRIDVTVAGQTIEPGGGGLDPGFRPEGSGHDQAPRSGCRSPYIGATGAGRAVCRIRGGISPPGA